MIGGERASSVCDRYHKPIFVLMSLEYASVDRSRVMVSGEEREKGV